MDDDFIKPPIYDKARAMLINNRPWYDKYKNLIWIIIISLPFIGGGFMAYSTAMENKRDIIQLREEMKTVKEFISAQNIMNRSLEEKIDTMAIDVKDIKNYLIKRK